MDLAGHVINAVLVEGRSGHRRVRSPRHFSQAVGGHVAAALQERGELAATTLHARLHPRHRDAFEASRLRVGAAFEVGQLYSPPIVSGQGVDEGTDTRRHVGQHRVPIVDPTVRAVSRARVDVRVKGLATPAAPSVMVGDRVSVNAEHPRGDPLVIVELADVLMDAQQHLGHDVLSLMGIGRRDLGRTARATCPTGPDLLDAERTIGGHGCSHATGDDRTARRTQE